MNLKMYEILMNARRNIFYIIEDIFFILIILFTPSPIFYKMGFDESIRETIKKRNQS
jgi:hypothetical protein